MDLHAKFRNLTPNAHADLQYYRDALDHVFSGDELRNIALSGAYGSGKSSVIRSYENIHQERTFIHISLAHFDEQGKRADSELEPSKIVNDLEGKILNQLIHQIPAKNIPQSYFPIQNNVSKKRHIVLTAAIISFFALSVYVLWFQRWTATIHALCESPVKTLLLYTADPYWRLTGIVMLLLLCGIGLYYFLNTYGLRRIFKKIDLKGTIGIELFATEEDSYFDKYLNKVLYLFDQADADAIVFEDMDR